jgi:LacI family transcriptional regulator
MPSSPFVYFHYLAGQETSVRVRDGFAARWSEVGRLPQPNGNQIAGVLLKHPGCAAFAGFLSHPELQAAARGAHCPVINYSNRAGLFAEGRNIVADDAEIGQLAAEHLLAKGYRRFAFVENEASGFADARCNSFEQALSRAGHPLTRLVFSPPDGLNPVEYDQLRCADMAGWLSRMEKPLGVLGANDAAAANFIFYAHQVSADSLPLLAVIGVDNTQPATFLFPPPGYLTSIEPDFEAVGAVIAEEMAEYLAGRPVEKGSVRRVGGARLIERESTGGLSSDDPLVARLGREIHRRVGRGEAPRVDELARLYGTSPRTLLNRFSAASGYSLREHLLRERLRRAAKLLRDGRHTVAEAAFACGFSKQGALSSHFKRQYGCTPREFQQRH